MKILVTAPNLSLPRKEFQMKFALALVMAMLVTVGCGGSPQTSLQPAAPPAPVVTPPPVPPSTPPPPPAMPTSWTVTDLAPLAGFNASQANAVNSAGVVVGYSETPAGVTEATLWANGAVIDLGPGIATAVNDSNHVVGYSVDATGSVVTAHLWFNGTTIDIGSWLPEGINHAGLVVGGDISGFSALEWTAEAGLMPVPGCSAALAVNDSGQIAGIDNVSLDATICGSASYGVPGAATAINTSGQAVGYSTVVIDDSVAMLFPGIALAQSGLATGINDLGWVVGETITGGQGNVKARLRGGNQRHLVMELAHLAGVSRPFIWSQASGLTALPDPLITAEGISGSRIVGAGLATDGTIHGMLLEGQP